jgi:hypothetical protein
MAGRALGAAGPDDGTCRNGDFPKLQTHFELRTATGARRIAFLADTDGCPSEARGCRTASYVLAGDRLIAGRVRGAYVCAFFPNRSGGAAGWMRADQLAAAAYDRSPPLNAWLGLWRDGDDRIRLSAHGGLLIADGAAYWPSADPSLSERPGGPNVGALSGSTRPTGPRAVFNDAQGQGEGCIAKLELVGPYLVVADNDQCGGMNVSFTGVYTRR